jgi:hypothetical protein
MRHRVALRSRRRQGVAAPPHEREIRDAVRE